MMMSRVTLVGDQDEGNSESNTHFEAGAWPLYQAPGAQRVSFKQGVECEFAVLSNLYLTRFKKQTKIT